MKPLPALATLAVLTAAGLAPLATTSVATAATPTCHGVHATLVGRAGHVLQGTAHRDVIVTHGAATVVAGDGDDLVCVTGQRREVSVDGGHGDDVVDVLSHRSQVAFRAGLGSDSYRGNAQFDDVRLRPDGHDVIRTGGGTDIVSVSPVARPGRPDVDLGPGADHLDLDSAGTGGRYLGGRGRDTLTLAHGSQHSWTIDAARGRALAGHQTRFRWSGIDAYDLSFLRAPSIDFLGSPAADTLYLQDGGTGQSRALQVATGAGDDHVTVSSLDPGAIDLGGGTDRLDLIVNYTGPSLVADLATHHAEATYPDGRSSSWTLSGVEDLGAQDYVTTSLAGDDGPNHLDISRSCQARADGRGGDDTLTVEHTGCSTLPAPAPVTPGVADGGDGVDTCAAEVVLACERS